MRELAKNIDENKLWRMCFPYLYEQSAAEGVYVVTPAEERLRQLELDGGGRSPWERAVSRLDMAISYLWPQVAELFVVDLFPHRLAAATDILRAVDFGEGQDAYVAALAGELAQALDGLEKLCARLADEERKLQAAEDSDGSVAP